MESRGMKRKRYAALKNDISVELHELTNASGDFNIDLQAANEDFEQMCRSMADRQSDFLTRGLLLEEKYGKAIAVIEGGKHETVGESSGENVILPAGYSDDVRKFVADAKVSLNGHGDILAEEYQQMEKIFQKYENVWNENLKEMKNRAAGIAKQRSKLCSKLSEFNRIVEED